MTSDIICTRSDNWVKANNEFEDFLKTNLRYFSNKMFFLSWMAIIDCKRSYQLSTKIMLMIFAWSKNIFICFGSLIIIMINIKNIIYFIFVLFIFCILIYVGEIKSHMYQQMLCISCTKSKVIFLNLCNIFIIWFLKRI